MNRKYYVIALLVALLNSLTFLPVYAQSDTLRQNIRLSYEEAKARMLKENLSLLAAHFSVTKAEAEAMQAKLWNNPYVIWNQDLYSIERNEYFNYRNQRLFQIEQVFSIAGKHTNTVKLARLSIELSKLQMEDILRSLVMELGDQYTALNATQQKARLYKELLAQYEQLLKTAEQQFKAGSMQGSELLRIKSELMTVQAEYIQHTNEQEALLGNIRILLNLPPTVDIITVSSIVMPGTLNLHLDSLLSTSMDHRPDYKLSQMQIQYEMQNLRLQKSMSVPDIKLAYQPHDKGSNYVRPYSGFNIEMPLPVFDRNQGRIQAAKVSVDQAELQRQQKANVLENEVSTAYYQYIKVQEGLQNYPKDLVLSMEEMNKRIDEAFHSKAIGISDYIEQRKYVLQTKSQLIDLQRDYTRSLHKLSFTIGKEIF